MNIHDLGSNLIPDSTSLQELPDAFLFRIEDSNSHLSGFGHSVQILNSSDSGYFGLTDPYTDVTSHRLDSFSISYYPLAEYEQMLVEPLSEDTPHQAQTEYTTAERRKASKAKYNRSDKRKANRAKYDRSDKGKASKARLKQTQRDKATRTKYARSYKNYLSQARYIASDKSKRTRSAYAATAKCKTKQAIRNARSNGYRKAIRHGFSEEVARKKGELAANNKRAELSLAFSSCVSVTQPKESSWPGSSYPERNGQKKDDDEWRDLNLCDNVNSRNPPLPQEGPASRNCNRTRAAYAATEKCKTMQAIRNARSSGYRKAIRHGFCEEVARKKGELAANNKRAELSLALSSCVSVTQPKESPRPGPSYPEQNGLKDDDEWRDLSLCDNVNSLNSPLPQEVPASRKPFYKY